MKRVEALCSDPSACESSRLHYRKTHHSFVSFRFGLMTGSVGADEAKPQAKRKGAAIIDHRPGESYSF